MSYRRSDEHLRAALAKRSQELPNGCIVWTGRLTKDGYGKVVVGATKRGAGGQPVRAFAHRVAWELEHGPVPAGKELDHLCRNRACRNAAHLEPVTRAVNVRRGDLPSMMRDHARRPRRAWLAECANGHSMTGANVGSNAKRRWCRACRREQKQRARSAQKRAAA